MNMKISDMFGQPVIGGVALVLVVICVESFGFSTGYTLGASMLLALTAVSVVALCFYCTTILITGVVGFVWGAAAIMFFNLETADGEKAFSVICLIIIIFYVIAMAIGESKKRLRFGSFSSFFVFFLHGMLLPVMVGFGSYLIILRGGDNSLFLGVLIGVLGFAAQVSVSFSNNRTFPRVVQQEEKGEGSE